jgi:Na+/H+-translocating membrane pyrophosphatase
MGADLYESYCGSILATAALGAAAFIGSDDTVMQFKAVIAPMLIAAVGIVLSIIGIFAVRTKENEGMKELLGSLATGTNLSSVLIVVATFLILWALGLENWVNISFAVVNDPSNSFIPAFSLVRTAKIPMIERTIPTAAISIGAITALNCITVSSEPIKAAAPKAAVARIEPQ